MVDGMPWFWDACNERLLARTLWKDGCAPQIIEDNYWAKLSFVPPDELARAKEETQSVALGVYRLVLEDGQDLSGSARSTSSDDEWMVCIHRGMVLDWQ
jgi:hypothetical protein